MRGARRSAPAGHRPSRHQARTSPHERRPREGARLRARLPSATRHAERHAHRHGLRDSTAMPPGASGRAHKPESTSARTSWALGATPVHALGRGRAEGESLQHIVMLAACRPARPLSRRLARRTPVLAEPHRPLARGTRTCAGRTQLRCATRSARRASRSLSVPTSGRGRFDDVGAEAAEGADEHEDDATGKDQTLATIEPPVSEEVTSSIVRIPSCRSGSDRGHRPRRRSDRT